MTYPCPKDPTHQSDDPDYCSVCGAKIAGSPPAPNSGGVGNAAGPGAVLNPAPPSLGVGGASGTICPDCGTPRVGVARFCEVCRHDFGAGTAGSAAAAPAAPAATPDAPAVTVAAPARQDLTPPPPPTLGGVLGGVLEAVTVVDPSLYVDPDPSMVLPVDEPPRTFPLDLAENLIGRRSDKRDIHPEVPLTDPGVSHRHAKLLREPDGGFVLLDVGSSNGTQLNGQDVPAGVRTPVKAGDEITLGCWTRITLRDVGAQP